MSEKSSSNIIQPLIWLSIFHIVGLFGLVKYADIFQRLIPLNLIGTFAFLLFYQKHWNIRIISYFMFVFTTTFIIEAIGVKTGLIFGSYNYGKSLGPKLFNTPLLIGINWLVIAYCASLMVKNLKFNVWYQAFVGACLMVMLDVLIEPVAGRFGMWYFKYNVPLQNYLAWFVISYVLIIITLNLKAKLRNDIAPYVFCVQLAFFILLNLFI
jgi:putative membrane protein